MSKSEENKFDSLEPISISLKQISNTLAHIAVNLEVNKDKTQLELVNLLLGLEFDRYQIASILGTSVASITARIAELKKKA